MTHLLTARSALFRNRTRAARNAAMFLHEAAADEVQFRLGMVKRTFTKPAIVTGHPDFWIGLFPDAVTVADDETLALEPGEYDLVIHAMSLHWANDPVGHLIQARRALKPDGLFLGICLGGETLHELRSALAEAEIAVMGGLSPRVLPMAAIRDLGGLMQRAGFALPVVDALPMGVSYRSVRHLMHDLRAMGEGNALTQRLRHPTKRAVFEQTDALYAKHFPDQDGRVHATYELMVLTGWAPDPSQPQPLRPGSATARLADALGTTEINGD